MGLLNMNTNEHILHEKYIAESARLRGREALLHQIDSEEEDIYYDPDIEYKDPVPVNIIFEDQPKPKLKKLGWLTEKDANPYLAIITNYADNNLNKDDITDRIKIRRYCRISLPSMIRMDDESEDTREFLITEVQGSSIDPIYWRCKLVPYRDKIDMVPSTPDVVDRTNDGNPADSKGTSYLTKEI